MSHLNQSTKIPASTGQNTDAYTPGSFETDDGQLERGRAWPSPRFTDNGDNTVTDNLTGLVWEQSVSTTATDLAGALSEVDGFGGGGHGDWRLPNTRELISLANFGKAEMDDWLNAGGFSGVQSGSGAGRYPWSSTRYPGNDPATYGTIVTWSGDGSIFTCGVGSVITVDPIAWPVRGGE